MSIINKLFIQSDESSYTLYTRLISSLTLLSILFIILESIESLSEFNTYFLIVEWFIVAIFTFDYLGNIIAKEKKFKYIFSFLGIADLISVLPTYIGLGNLTFLKSVRIARLFRLLRLARLAKLSKISKGTKGKEDDIHFLYKVNLEIYFAALFATILIFGSVYNLIEPDLYPSIPIGMLLSAELIVAGLSYTEPETLTGVLLTILNRFAGLVLFGLLISVVGNAVRKFLFGTAKLVNEDKELFS